MYTLIPSHNWCFSKNPFRALHLRRMNHGLKKHLNLIPKKNKETQVCKWIKNGRCIE